MNKLLAVSVQQEVRYQTVGRKVQAVLSRNELELAMPFPLPVLGLNTIFVLLQMHFTLTTDMKLTFIMTKVYLKFEILIF